MATKSKASTKRTKVKDLPKSKREMSGKDMQKIKGGLALTQRKAGGKPQE